MLNRVHQIIHDIRMHQPAYRCRQSLKSSPIPLHDDEIELAVLFSAKAGCTFATKWFFFQIGILDEALAYSEWPHRYRLEVFIRQPGYRERLDAVPDLGARVIKFVRNPYDRAVSGYLHFCHWLQDDEALQQHAVLRDLSEHLGRPLSADATFTFREFVGFLGASDLTTVNPHIRLQVSPCERLDQLPQMIVIKIEDSARLVPEVESRLGLKPSNLQGLGRSIHHTKRTDRQGFFADTPFYRTAGVDVPRSAAFYDDELLAEVGRLYAEDCQRYAYDPPASLASDVRST